MNVPAAAPTESVSSYNTLAQSQQQVAPVSTATSSNVISNAPVRVYAVDGVYTASNINNY
jgi:hypothetical protein